MPGPAPLTIQHYKDLLTRLVGTWENLQTAERAGDAAAVEKLRAGLRQLVERARDAAGPDA